MEVQGLERTVGRRGWGQLLDPGDLDGDRGVWRSRVVFEKEVEVTELTSQRLVVCSQPM